MSKASASLFTSVEQTRFIWFVVCKHFVCKEWHGENGDTIFQKYIYHILTIYQYLQGRVELTPKRARRITDAYPEINYLYLIGEEDILVLDSESLLEQSLLKAKKEREENPLEWKINLLNENVVDLQKQIAILTELVDKLVK